jgi:hypothetical protein
MDGTRLPVQSQSACGHVTEKLLNMETSLVVRFRAHQAHAGTVHLCEVCKIRARHEPRVAAVDGHSLQVRTNLVLLCRLDVRPDPEKVPGRGRHQGEE